MTSLPTLLRVLRTTLLPAALAAATLAGLGGTARAGEGLEVFQGLDELTARIPRLKQKPFERLLAKDGGYPPEIVIFRDQETGAEIWSLTFEECKELANIERRCPWNCDGSILSMKGNRTFRAPDGTLSHSTWDGFSYLANGDGSNPCKFRVTFPDGTVGELTDKFNTWDRKDPRALYFAAVKSGASFRSWWSECPPDAETWLVRVHVGDDLRSNRMEPLCRFPNGRRKLIQNISDDNKLCIQDINGKGMEDMPSFYLVDLNKKPGDAGFLQAHPLAYGITEVPGHDPKNEYHVHGITISRDGKSVSWNYGPMTDVGEPIGFSVPSDSLNARPVAHLPASDRWGQYLSHPDTWLDGRIAYFAGPTDQTKTAGIAGGWGVWLRLPEKPPVYTGKGASGGHITWTGNDPDWFFANISRPDKGWDTEVKGRIVAGKADGSVLQVLCNPYDRRRGGIAGYDGIPRAIQSPDATKCWFHSSMLMSSDAFTGSFIAVFRRPHPPTELRVERVGARLRLAWKPHPVSSEVKGYHVYRRGPGEQAAWQDVSPGAVPGTELALALPTQPGGYEFAVTAEEHSRLESDVTSPVAPLAIGAAGSCAFGPARPGIKGWDKTPPGVVAGFHVRKDPAGGCVLSWQASPARDLRHYHLYCSAAGRPQAVQARRIASPPAGSVTFLDWSAPPGAEFYAITAVDRQGNESAPAFAESP